MKKLRKTTIHSGFILPKLDINLCDSVAKSETRINLISSKLCFLSQTTRKCFSFRKVEDEHGEIYITKIFAICTLPNLDGVVKPIRMRWTKNVTRTEKQEMRAKF